MGEGLGSGYYGGVRAVTVFRGDVVAVGDFRWSGTSDMSRAARWDGATWRALGQGLDGPATVVGVYHDRLYVSGTFHVAGGTNTNGLATWDGADWTAVPWNASPLVYTNRIDAMAVANDLLYVGGSFDSAGTVPAHSVAAWDGAGWSAVGSLVGIFDVTALAAHGNALVAAPNYSGLWEWNGTTWTPRRSNLSGGFATSLIDDDLGSVVTGSVSVYAPGTADLVGSEVLVSSGGDFAPLLTWSSDMHGFSQPGVVYQIGRYGTDILAAGFMDFVADDGRWTRMDGLALWDGGRWRPFPGWNPGLGSVNGFASNGNTLVAVGSFIDPKSGGWALPGFVFDGTQWTPTDTVSSMLFSPTWFRGALYAGAFPTGGYLKEAPVLYRLDGTHWTEIARATANSYNSPMIETIAVHEDRLVVGGLFASINGVPAGNIASWDGEEWTAFGDLDFGSIGSTVFELKEIDRTLYAAGDFGPPSDAVARWDGSAWRMMGLEGYSFTIASLDGQLVAAATMNGTGADELQGWNGVTWTRLASLNGRANSMFVDGNDLWLGGQFTLVDGVPSSLIASWRTATPSPSRRFALSPGYPNPMRESIAFTYSLPATGEVALTVSDARGRHVATLDRGTRGPGDHFVQWDGRDLKGQRAPAGVYFVRLAGTAETSRKIVLLP